MARAVNDRTGQKLGRLTVLERAGSDKWGTALWLCKCECGSKPKIISGSNLRNTRSCGCLQDESRKKTGKFKGKAKDITGQKFGKLTALRRKGSNKEGHALWECQCECGSDPITVTGKRLRLKNGAVKSCGCLKIEKSQEKREDLQGKVFDALTALEYIPGSGETLGKWKCKCECGLTVEMDASDLKRAPKRYRRCCGDGRCAADPEFIGPILPRKIAKEKGLKTYFPGIRCSQGHFSEHLVSNMSCLICHNNRCKKFRDENPEKSSEYARKHNSKASSKLKRNIYLTNRRNEDPAYLISERCKNYIKAIFRNKRIPKDSYSARLIGINNWEELADHIESQFGNSYSWENRDQWDIDHIRPTSSFNLEDKDQRLVAFNWRNLQPLWSTDNQSKRDFYEPHDEAEWARRMRDLGYDGELFLLFEEGRGGLCGQQATAGEVDHLPRT